MVGARVSKPPPKPKRVGGPSGPPGQHKHPMRRFHAPAGFLKLMDRAVKASPYRDVGYSEWVRRRLAVAIADQLNLSLCEVEALLDE